MSSHIFCDADKDNDWNGQGMFAFTLTYEGWPLGTTGGPLTRWGTYTGTITPDPGTSLYQAKGDLLHWIRTKYQVDPAKVLCFDLIENQVPHRGPTE